MPFPSPRRRRRRMEPTSRPDWAALPHDILCSVFLTLGQREIMRGPELVCTAWRRVAVDEPALWRRVDMGNAFVLRILEELRISPMVRAAVDRGADHCVAFSGPLDDDLLFHLVERARFLTSISITLLAASNKVLNMALKKLPLLEDLSILQIRRALFVSCDNQKLLESVCQACPHLKNLKLSSISFGMRYHSYYDDNGKDHSNVTYTIPLMCELRSLKLFDCDLNTEALSAILDSCPLLESLKVDGSFNGTIDEQLQEKCGRVKNFFIPEDESDPITDFICEEDPCYEQ